MGYNVITHTGMTSSATVDPRTIAEDFKSEVLKIKPDQTPLITLTQYFGNGPKPTSHKIKTIQQYADKRYDKAIECKLGVDLVGADFQRFALIKVDYPTHLTTRNITLYYPQDTLYIARTSQTVEVVMNDITSLEMSVDGSSKAVLPVKLTGATTTTCKKGYIVVKTIEDVPFKGFSQSTVAHMGRTIYEGQRVGGVSTSSEDLYDYNFVEQKEKIVEMTKDMKDWVQGQRLEMPRWDRNLKEAMAKMKQEIEHMAMFGVRGVHFTIPRRPKRFTEGALNAIRTNVSVYNPHAVTDFEQLISTWCRDQVFNYNPNGTTKFALVGRKFLYAFNDAFRDIRRINGTAPTERKAGLMMDTYQTPEGYTLKLIPTDLFSDDMSYWAMTIDPKEMEKRTITEFSVRPVQAVDERVYRSVIEWQGAFAFHREQSMALLKTY